MKKKTILAFSIGVALTAAGCGGQAQDAGNSDQEPYQKQVFAMDTFMTLTAYGEHAKEALDAAAEEIERLDNLLSTGQEQSEVSRLNANGGGSLSEDTSYLLKRALEIHDMTDGQFDISIYPVMEAWGFTTQEFRVPDEDELAELLTKVDSSKINYDAPGGRAVFESDGMKIDFGGIAKGYTSARVMEIFEDYGVAHGLVSLGGNVQVLGTNTNGKNWRIGIQNPDLGSNYLGVLEACDVAVITSGAYERYFEKDGVTYHHIIDPDTGYPAKSGLISVTIVSSDGTLADGLSTALYVMGRDEAISFWKKHSEMFDCILYTEDGELYVTEGLADRFSSDDFTYNIVDVSE